MKYLSTILILAAFSGLLIGFASTLQTTSMMFAETPSHYKKTTPIRRSRPHRPEALRAGAGFPVPGQ